jgi:hypothetical protein
MDLVGYTGTIKAQAAETYQSDWFDVTDSESFLNYTGTVYKNIVGWYPLVRMGFNNSVYSTGANGTQMGYPAQAMANVVNGVLTSITILDPGLGYLAPPLITILGDGAGATAVATLGSQGTVSSINVVTGGSGYRANPLNNIAATVVISTGRVENILYR